MRTKHLFLFLCLLLPSVAALVDFQISAPNITFSNDHPVEGENVTINATIYNLGNESANNVLIDFFDDAVHVGNHTINLFPASAVTVFQPWIAEIGQNNITVTIDQNSFFAETNETNNNATKRVSISAYHTYVGRVSSLTILGMESSVMLAQETPSCNILVTDSDSNVDFSSLKAMGRRKTFGVGLNDFIDVDSLLNMTFFDDSISMEWTFFGNFPSPFFKIFPQEVKTFVVFNETISGVPIINSTNLLLLHQRKAEKACRQ